MLIVPWSEWLDQHIPYYERNKQIAQHLDNPPASILVISPVDRNRKVTYDSLSWDTWDAMNSRIKDLNYQTKPIFLVTDTHQRWYWAFWSEKEAVLALLQLS